MKYSYRGNEATDIYFQLLNGVKKLFEDVNVMTFPKQTGGAFFVITGKRYFFRNKSTTGIVVAVEASDVEILVETKALAGGTGILDVSWGSVSKAEEMVEEILMKLQFDKI